MIIEFDTNAPAEEQIRNLRDSVQRAIDGQTGNEVVIKRILETVDADLGDITANAITANELSARSGKLENMILKDSYFANGSITGSKIQDSSITGSKISGSTIENSHLVGDIKAEKIDIDSLVAEDGFIQNLATLFIKADGANINEAFMRKVIVDNGTFKNAIVCELDSAGTITGVQIIGDYIKANTIVAEKLIIYDKTTDKGLIYALNDGVMTQSGMTADELKRTTLNGEIITAQSVTAEKISVNDLAAFNATIAGIILDGEAYTMHSAGKTNVLSGAGGFYFDKDGQFSVGAGTSFFRWYRDGNNVWKLDINADTIRFGSSGTSVEEVSSEVSSLNNFVQKSVETTAEQIEGLQAQVDGSIQTWFFEIPPAGSNPPTNEWTTTEQKNVHLGDLYYDTVTGYCYRYQVQNNLYEWQRITDVDVTKALSDAAKAQDTANSKKRVFKVEPTPPYDVGDLWVQGVEGDILSCQTRKITGQTYSLTDWEKSSKYTDDEQALLAQDSAETAQNAAESLGESVADLYDNQTTLDNTLNDQQGLIEEVETAANNAQSSADTAKTTADSATAKAETVRESVGEVQEKFAEVERMIVINPDEPSITLSAGENSVVISDEGISLNSGGEETAYLEGNALLVQNEYITTYYPRVKQDNEWVGKLAWVARSNGHLSLKVVKGGVE